MKLKRILQKIKEKFTPPPNNRSRKLNIKYIEKQNILISSKCQIGNGCLFDGRGGQIIIGDSFIIGDSKFHASYGYINIGDNVTVGQYCFFNGAGGITIEDNVLCADKINIVSEEHVYSDINRPVRDQGVTSKPITIGEGTWIGINVTILAGTKIGKNCVIGANSVVKGVFQDYCVIAGIPAKIIKEYVNGVWKYY